MPVKRSNISWTDYSGMDLNFLIGCTPISAGCQHCYARTLIENRWGKDFSQIRVYPEKLERLRTARFEAKDKPFRRGSNSKPLAFVCDMSDLFHKDVDDSLLLDFFSIVYARQDVDWQVLTKRPARAIEFFNVHYGKLPDNLWFGVTIENEKVRPYRAQWLDIIKSNFPNITTFISAEPLLEYVSFATYWQHMRHIDWIIVGGESGNNRREFNKAWVRKIRDDCIKHDTAFFFKQGSHRYPGRNYLLDGKEYKEFPK